MDSDVLSRALLDAAWISARIATAFGAVLALCAMVIVRLRGGQASAAGESDAGPRAHRAGAGARVAAQLGAVILGALITAWTRGQAEAWLPAPAQAIVATLAALAVLFAGTFVAWAAWSLGSSFTVGAIVGPRATLVTHGPFALVRHPFYAAWGLLGTGAALAFASLAGAAVFLAAWIPATRWRAGLEDTVLAEAWPGEWERYAARTPGFLPKW